MMKDLVQSVTALRPLATGDRRYWPGAGVVDGRSIHLGDTANFILQLMGHNARHIQVNCPGGPVTGPFRAEPRRLGVVTVPLRHYLRREGASEPSCGGGLAGGRVGGGGGGGLGWGEG